MPSPFPGIDPYIESQHRWPDFHSRLTNSCCEAISDQLPDSYHASIDERVEIREVDSDDKQSFVPDVAILRDAPEGRGTPAFGQQVEGAAPAVTMNLPAIREERTRKIEIFRTSDSTLVTVLELLSPTNKNPPGRAEYLAKRADLLAQEIHLVELDLLIAGRPLPMEHALPIGHFYSIVARSDRRPSAQVYSWKLRDRLPSIVIPLLERDGGILVDLAKAYDVAYDRGRYHKTLQYADTLELPMNPEDAQWARHMARE